MDKLITFKDTNGVDSLQFYCQGCKTYHSVVIKRPKEGIGAEGPIWGWNKDMEKPTFTPSVLVRWYDGPKEDRTNFRCHMYVRNGQIEYLKDCLHKLAGTTVKMMEE